MTASVFMRQGRATKKVMMRKMLANLCDSPEKLITSLLVHMPRMRLSGYAGIISKRTKNLGTSFLRIHLARSS